MFKRDCAGTILRILWRRSVFASLPNVMREIGRLREKTFRIMGDGRAEEFAYRHEADAVTVP